MVNPIPAPTQRVEYAAPTFQTFQEKRRAREAQRAGVSGTFGMLPASSSSRALPTPPPSAPPAAPTSVASPHAATHPSYDHVASTHVQPPYNAHPSTQASPVESLERSDTLASIRSLDRQSSRRPLPKPPVVVASSKSLDRGMPRRKASEDASPSIVLPGPEINVSNAAVPDIVVPSIFVPDIIVPEVANEPAVATQPAPGFTISAPPTIAVTTEPQRIETDHAILCGGCGHPIIGRIVNAMQQRFHPQCFGCSECGELLEHVSSYECEGRAYCHLDYHNKFAHQCFHCKTPIVEARFITLNDETLGQRYYHELHFFCSECGDPFLDPTRAQEAEETGAFTIHRGHPYCERCHLRLHKPKCKGCKLPIPDVAVNASGGKWHKACFKCDMCGREHSEVFFPLDGMAVCPGCYDG